MLAEAPLVLHGWLCSGKAGSARGVVPFLQEALALMPADWKLRTVRADWGFFDQALLGFLEERSLPYIIVARLTRSLKVAAASIKDWTPLDAHYSSAGFQLQLHGWSKQRRFVVIRELESEDKSAGAAGQQAGALVYHRIAWVWSQSLRRSLPPPQPVPELNRSPSHAMTQRYTKTWDECGSLFFSEASRMDSLCPECAHLLYGYESCRHTFVDGRCSSCHWDGSVSEYCRTLKREDSR